MVTGHAELTSTTKLDRSQPVGAEVGELDLRYSYEHNRIPGVLM
jgi:hypothetical protein